MSRETAETAEARAEARHWDETWKRHRPHCPQCSYAAQHRDASARCPDGADIWRERAAANAELARNRELDKQPSPDQEPLSGVSPGWVHVGNTKKVVLEVRDGELYQVDDEAPPLGGE